MAFVKHTTEMVEPATRFLDVTFTRSDAVASPGVYRCRCCGEEIAFDSLVAACRCSEECYVESLPLPLH